MRFQVLGPISVTDGVTELDIGGPQQRLVQALLVMYANEAVSTERIIDILWQDEPPPTARKTIQGYVSALRRALGEGAITTTVTGYRLAADRQDIDALDFADRITEARAIADPTDRGDVLRAALELWRGAAYDDVAFVDVFHPEIARLDELKMVAIGEQLAADMETGPASAAIPPLEALVREHPLQERFRALLMVALYRSGRQTEALRVFEDARRHLAAEVGLEPGSELRLLEQRILEQDPALDRESLPGLVSVRTEAANPYRGLRPFDERSADKFYGREALVRRLLEELTGFQSNRLIIVAGPSGSGKSSLVRAGLIPALSREGRSTKTLVPGPDPLAELTAAVADGPDVVVVDQMENALVAASTATEFLQLMVETVGSPGAPQLVATVRSDYLDVMLAHPEVGPLVEDALILVPPMTRLELSAAIESPAAAAGVEVTPAVTDTVFVDMAGRAAALPLLQYALTEMFDRISGFTMSLDDYHLVGGLGGALASRAEAEFQALSVENRGHLRSALLHLVQLKQDGDPGLRRLALSALSADQIAALESFGRHRMVTFDRGNVPTVEIAHEALLREWPRLASWLDDARDVLLAQRRLAFTAAEWDAAGRGDDFLFTSTLVAQHDDRPPSPGSVEAEFLSASRFRNHAATRRKRRTRMLTTAALGTAAAASLLLAVLANQGRNEADQARAEAEARAVASAALAQIGNDSELGLLLGVEAYRLNPTTEGLSPVIAALERVTDRDELFTGSVHPAGTVTEGLFISSPEGSASYSLSCAAETGPGRFLAGESGGGTGLVSDVVTGFVLEISSAACQMSLHEDLGKVIETPHGADARVGGFGTRVVIKDVNRAQWLPDGRIIGLTAGAEPGPFPYEQGVDYGDGSERAHLAWVNHETGVAEVLEETATTVSVDPTGQRLVLTDRDVPVGSGVALDRDAPVVKYIVAADDLATEHDLGAMDAARGPARWSDDGALVGDVSRAGHLRIWNTRSGEQIVDARLASGNPDDLAWIDFSPSGRLVGILDGGQDITLYRTENVNAEPIRLQASSPVAATSFITEDRLAVMRADGAIEVFDFTVSAFVDEVVACCGLERIAGFSLDGSSGQVRRDNGSPQLVALPGGIVDSPDLGEGPGIWRGPNGRTLLVTSDFELIDLNDLERRSQPFGSLPSSDFESNLLPQDDNGLANAWVLTTGTTNAPAAVVVGRIEMTTLQAAEGPHRIELPANSVFVQAVNTRLVAQNSMGTIFQFGFDGQPVSRRVDMPFVATSIAALPGSPIALIAGESELAVIDLDAGIVLSSADVESPSPVALVSTGLAVIGRQGGGIDLWSTEPLLRLGRLADADNGSIIQLVSIDDAGNVWYSSGARYQRIPIDPEAWIEKACELAGSALTGDQWRQFVSATRPYDPAC